MLRQFIFSDLGIIIPANFHYPKILLNPVGGEEPFVSKESRYRRVSDIGTTYDLMKPVFYHFVY